MKRVPRSEWGARPPRSTPARIASEGITVHHVGPKVGDAEHSSCATRVRGIQAFHMDSRGWSDIAYNWLACRHGYLFEGRGYGRRSAANGTDAGNSRSHAINALIGDGDTITDDLLHALRDGIDLCRNLRGGPRLWVHQDWKATSCPGRPLVDWVRRGAPRPAPVAPPPPPPITTPEDDMPLALVRRKGGTAVYLTDFMERRWVTDGVRLVNIARRIGKAPTDIESWDPADVDALLLIGPGAPGEDPGATGA